MRAQACAIISSSAQSRSIRAALGTDAFAAWASRRPRSSQTNAFANAKRTYERYIVLVRAPTLTGDTIETENLYQHAGHYFRLMMEQAV
jgi:hypothetical protein